MDQFKEERFIFRHAELRCQWSTQMEICGGQLEINVKNLGEKSGLRYRFKSHLLLGSN